MNLRNSHGQRRMSARQGRRAKARALSRAEFSPNKEDFGGTVDDIYLAEWGLWFGWALG